MKVQILVVVVLLHAAHAHISLTFPPARFPNYDFLDNVRTGGPCGVPENPNGAVTTFQAGSTINVKFHLAYPHRGGVLINIVNRNGSISFPLLGTRWVNVNDSTRLQQDVTLPEGFTCDRCMLQLLRQAGEWAAPGGGYVFWSCADISVVDSAAAVCNGQTCSGHGTCDNNGRCTCDRLYTGEFCQDKEECLDDSDCNNRGSCVDIEAASSVFPRRQCFCNPGWFGEGCARQSSISDADIDPALYTIRRQLHERLVLHARIVGGEIEVALKHNGTGYVALGWRPSRGIDGTCRAQAPGDFPLGSHRLWPDEQTIPMYNSSTNNVTNIILPLFILGGGAEEGGAEEGGAEEGGAEEGPAEEGGADEEGRVGDGGAEEGPAEEGGADEEGRTEDGGSQEGGAEEGGSQEGGAEEGGAEEGPAEEGPAEEGGTRVALHPMDCTDIVIGVARGNQFRVIDYYTRDRSTPRKDDFYGGQDSITGAIAKEENGITYVKWRKPLSTDDPADHSITNQLMSVIWSFGQVFPDYFHNPGSGIEAGTAQNTRFYQPDQIKYHGTRNRGSTSINFFDVDSDANEMCRGGFSTGCDAQGQSCDYRASWKVKGFLVEFTVTARQVQNGRTEWVAIGFSDDRWMPNSDVVVGAADATGFFVTDRYIDARAVPPIDESQDIFNATATFDNGFTTMKFSRPLASSNPHDLSLSQCRFFLYGWSGPANVETKGIGYHMFTPARSTDMICLPEPQECGALSGATRIATPITILSMCVVLLVGVLFLA